MSRINQLFTAIDNGWKPIGKEPITLQIVGSTALMVQCSYARGTKDADIIDLSTSVPEATKQLELLAGKQSNICKQFHIYLDLVSSGIMFKPSKPIFHAVKAIQLKNFVITAMDITDVVVSKLKRFNSNDRDDIRAMVQQKHIRHARLVERFKLAIDGYSMDARAEEFHKYIKNLNEVERDMLLVPESSIDLPPWMDQ